MRRIFLSLAILLSVLVFSSSCKTKPATEEPPPPPVEKPEPPPRNDPQPQPPPPRTRTLTPFTVPLLEESLEKNNGDWVRTLRSVEFYLSNEIVLERIDIVTSIDFNEGAIRRSTSSMPEKITFEKNLSGIGWGGRRAGRRRMVNVAFDSGNLNLQLTFTNAGNPEEGRFFLDFSPDNTLPADEKGTLAYGSSDYTIKFGGDTDPYLLVDFTEIEATTPSDKKIPGVKWKDLFGDTTAENE